MDNVRVVCTTCAANIGDRYSIAEYDDKFRVRTSHSTWEYVKGWAWSLMEWRSILMFFMSFV